MSGLSTTFSNWQDRLTYIVAEAQILVGGVLFSVAVALIWLRPSIPGIPPIFMGWFAALLLLGPPVFGFFVWLIHKVRTRHMEEIHHVNAVKDILKKYYVEPDLWKEKSIDGPNPYPVNGNTAWAVREFEHDEEMGELRVEGVWLEETTDVKLMTKKSHMESIYGTLTESHIALQIFRDSVSEFGAGIQKRLTNRMAEAREAGKMMDKKAVKEVFEEFEESAKGHGPDDLPTLDPEDEGEPEPAESNADDNGVPGPSIEQAAETAASEAAATDGGTNQ